MRITLVKSFANAWKPRFGLKINPGYKHRALSRRKVSPSTISLDIVEGI
jgi:hypothetical protein